MYLLSLKKTWLLQVETGWELGLAGWLFDLVGKMAV